MSTFLSMSFAIWSVGLLSFISASLPGDAPTPPRPDWTPPRVTLTSEAVVTPTGHGFWVKVMLNNDQPGCRPVIINDTFWDLDEHRPDTLLTFQIKDETGQDVPSVRRPGGTRLLYTVRELITLRCGANYGSRVPVGGTIWNHRLGPGKYTVRARVENRVRSFFEREPRELKRPMDASLLEKERLMPLLSDFVAVSDEITVEVK